MGLNFVKGGWGKNLVEAMFMSVYRRLAANSTQNQVKKGRCPNTFGPGLYHNLENPIMLSENRLNKF